MLYCCGAQYYNRNKQTIVRESKSLWNYWGTTNIAKHNAIVLKLKKKKIWKLN